MRFFSFEKQVLFAFLLCVVSFSQGQGSDVGNVVLRIFPVLSAEELCSTEFEFPADEEFSIPLPVRAGYGVPVVLGGDVMFGDTDTITGYVGADEVREYLVFYLSERSSSQLETDGFSHSSIGGGVSLGAQRAELSYTTGGLSASQAEVDSSENWASDETSDADSLSADDSTSDSQFIIYYKPLL
jgi:hypothetical protein